ncbi:hypothetical protein Sbal195_4576 (plasmid) [Shewanella baltica OS195]|uniref:Uncharacterized protein n=1 Tax=Shewanella baltica (strain OS195) TaxID=399599 RepID=A9L6F0_SHEB9|nr:hypothetical protein Sbal195_4576 [Shewanella baltica OS195]
MLHEIKKNIVSIDQLTTAQQIMASLAFNKPEMLPSNWLNKSRAQLFKRLSIEQRYAIKLYLKPYMKYVYIWWRELLIIAPMVIVPFLFYYSSLYFLGVFETKNPLDPFENALDSSTKLYGWLFSLFMLTGVWVTRFVVFDAELRFIDVVYHLLISMALVYCAFSSLDNLPLIIVFIVEFGAIKCLVESKKDSSN